MEPRQSEILSLSAGGFVGPWAFGSPEQWEAENVEAPGAWSITGGESSPVPLWLEGDGEIGWWDWWWYQQYAEPDPVGEYVHHRLHHPPYRQLAASDTEVCALRAEGGTLDCVRALWRVSYPPYYQPDGHYTVEGSYTMVDLGDDYNCAIEAESEEVYCWGPNLNELPPRPLPGVKFSTISVGVRGGCGVTTGGAIRCWTRDGPPPDFEPAE